MSKTGSKTGSIPEKMSKHSDQQVPEHVKGEPAFGKNIKELPEEQVKKEVADKMKDK